MCTLYPGVIWREISFCIKNGLSISSGNVTLYLHCIGLIVQYNPNTQHVEWSCFSTDEESERGEKLGQELRKYRLGVVFTIFIIGLYWDTEDKRAQDSLQDELLFPKQSFTIFGPRLTKK